MSESIEVAIIGVHHTSIANNVSDQSLEEMIFEASRGALADAGLDISDIDGVILATSDQMSGRVIESMVTNGAAGGVGRDVTTLASAGEHAVVYAYLRLLAGQGERLLVLAWSKPSESRDPGHAERVAAEPFLIRPLGMDVPTAAGLQASAYVARYGRDDDAVAKVRRARTEAAERAYKLEAASPDDSSQPQWWPLSDADLPRRADVACAMVMASGSAASAAPNPAWVIGAGWATDSYDLGDRDLTRFGSLEAAARQCRLAELIDEETVFEVQEISTIGSFAAYESLGLCHPGDGSSVASRPMVNPSGGNLPVEPGNAAGFMRLLAAAQQVRGRAQDTQIFPRPKRSVGATLHGFAGQGAAIMVFDAAKRAS